MSSSSQENLLGRDSEDEQREWPGGQRANVSPPPTPTPGSQRPARFPVRVNRRGRAAPAGAGMQSRGGGPAASRGAAMQSRGGGPAASRGGMQTRGGGSAAARGAGMQNRGRGNRGSGLPMSTSSGSLWRGRGSPSSGRGVGRGPGEYAMSPTTPQQQQPQQQQQRPPHQRHQRHQQLSGTPGSAAAVYSHRPMGVASPGNAPARDSPFQSQPSTDGSSSATASATGTDPRGTRAGHPGPLTSHPTAEYLSPVRSSTPAGRADSSSAEPLRQSQSTGSIASSSGPRRRAAPRQTLLPVPEGSATGPPQSEAVARLREENVPPLRSGGGGSLGASHRDSLELPHLRNVPRRSPGSDTKRHAIYGMPGSMEHLPDVPEVPQLPSQLPLFPQSQSQQLLQPPRQQQQQQQEEEEQQQAQETDPRREIRLELQGGSSAAAQGTEPGSSKKPRQSGIPRSRTMNAISNIASSLSLPKFGRTRSRSPAGNNPPSTGLTFFPSQSKHALAGPSSAEAGKGKGKGKEKATAPPLGARISSPQSSTAYASGVYAQATSSAGGASTQPSWGDRELPARPARAYEDKRHVHVAKSMTYWTGRFEAQQNKSRNEMLQPRNLAALLSTNPYADPAAAAQNPPTHKPEVPTAARTTMSLFPSTASSTEERAAQLRDEPGRARGAFAQLAAFCKTDEALRSLYAFQQVYARREGDASLLPPGGTMEDNEGKGKGKGKSFVDRLFKK
ncbi:hypothetical protein GGR54DRAFT_651466 [Hypoxylon sp. NC1633]|nr:hypothetical protein GGR54DRAFT_651466 [Hypoxylon sp. NC1633]